MELRPYQIEVIDKINKEWEHQDSVMLQMPTGTGKTNVFCQIIKTHRSIFPTTRILILTHKRELVYQTRKELNKISIVPGIIMSLESSNPDHQIQIATVQTLIRRKGKLNFLRNVSLIVIDEAHHTPSETYRDLLNHYKSKNTRILGVTAMPKRTDGKGFSDIFNVLVQSWSIKEFIDKGFLADVEHQKTATYFEIKNKLKNISIDKKTNDFDEYELSQLMTTITYMSDAVESYIKFRGDYKKSIVFAVNVKHSKHLAARFNSQGITAAHIDGTIDKISRDAILSDFSSGLISVLCNVGIVTEGFDCPDAEIVQLVRPTKSITLYLQQVGRVLRPKQDGRHAIILDSACCYDEFGSVKSDRKWTLDSYEDSIHIKHSEPSPEEKPLSTKLPIEHGDDMVQVDRPSSNYICKLDVTWLEKLTPEIQEYFVKRFSHIELSQQELIRAIWIMKEINLSRIPLDTIRDLKNLLNIESLNISNTNCESLYPVTNLINLKVLNISYCKANILRLPSNNNKLSKLNISGTAITDIKELENYSYVTELIANNTKFKSYTPISKLSRLTRFSGNHSEFNSLHDLWGSRESIRVMELYNSNLDTLNVIHHFKRINELDISFTRVSSLESIYLCRSLTRLVIKGINVNARSLAELRNKRPDISIEV